MVRHVAPSHRSPNTQGQLNTRGRNMLVLCDHPNSNLFCPLPANNQYFISRSGIWDVGQIDPRMLKRRLTQRASATSNKHVTAMEPL